MNDQEPQQVYEISALPDFLETAAEVLWCVIVIAFLSLIVVPYRLLRIAWFWIFPRAEPRRTKTGEEEPEVYRRGYY